MISRFTPTSLRVDVSRLSAGDRQALVKLVQASRILDDIFLNQYWSGKAVLYARLQMDSSALGGERLHYVWVNKSQWSALDVFKPNLSGVQPRKPEGADFYAEEMSKPQFESSAG